MVALMTQPAKPEDDAPAAQRPTRPTAPRRVAVPVRPSGARPFVRPPVAPPPLASTPGPSLDTPVAEARLSILGMMFLVAIKEQASMDLGMEGFDPSLKTFREARKRRNLGDR